MGCSFIAPIQSAAGSVASNPIVRIAAPIIVGAFLGPAAGALLGTSSGVGAAAAGALTGAGLAAGTGGNILSGAVMGGIGGYGGGMLNPSAGVSFGGTAGLSAENAAAIGKAIESGAMTVEQATALAQEAGVGTATGQGILGAITNATGLSTPQLSGMLQGAMQLGGSYLNNASYQDAAATQAQAQIRAAQIAADAAKFRPVGITTNFGQSQFGYDANGNLISAGYRLTPKMKAQQDTLMGISNQNLNQYQNAQAATAPMGRAAQTMFNLGQGYLNQTPEQQAAQYMAQQQGLLAPSRATDYANLQNRLLAQGRSGLAVGGDAGMMAANPELNAYYNALNQQNLQLAANATQGGMDYAKFGAGMVGAGGDMLRDMYANQNAAYQPYQTALGGAANIENLGQEAMGLGTSIGAKSSTAQAQAGLLQAQGMINAANTMAPANAISPWGGLLSGGANILQNYNNQQSLPTYNPNQFRPVPFGA